MGTIQIEEAELHRLLVERDHLREQVASFEAMRALLGPCVDAAYKMVGALINGGTAMPLCVDLPEFADALGDIDYVVEGTRLTLGIPRLPVAFEIQAANMAKTRTQLAGADAAKLGGWSKPTKPEGWKPPNIEGVLRMNGWLGESEPWRPRNLLVQSI